MIEKGNSAETSLKNFAVLIETFTRQLNTFAPSHHLDNIRVLKKTW